MSNYHRQWMKRYHQEHREELNEKQRQYRFAHLDAYHTYDRNARQKLKLEVLTYYSNGLEPRCLHCGENDIDVLCIDHIYGGGNQHRKDVLGNKVAGGSAFHRWLKHNDFPEGFQVLCHNCNARKRIHEDFKT